MASKLLITQQEIINRTIASVNFDDSLIKDAYIESAQWDYIRPLLGEDLYDAVLATPTDYSTLIDYIKDCLAFYALAKAMPFIHYAITSQGVQLNFTDYTRTATNEDKQKLVEGVLDIADDYREKLEDYLSDNTSTYTTYGNTIADTKKYGGIIL